MKYVITGHASTSSWEGCGRTIVKSYSGKSVFDALMELYNDSVKLSSGKRHCNAYSDGMIFADIGYDGTYAVTDIKVYSDTDELVGYCYKRAADGRRVEQVGQKCLAEIQKFSNWKDAEDKKIDSQFVDL